MRKGEQEAAAAALVPIACWAMLARMDILTLVAAAAALATAPCCGQGAECCKDHGTDKAAACCREAKEEPRPGEPDRRGHGPEHAGHGAPKK